MDNIVIQNGLSVNPAFNFEKNGISSESPRADSPNVTVKANRAEGSALLDAPHGETASQEASLVSMSQAGNSKRDFSTAKSSAPAYVGSRANSPLHEKGERDLGVSKVFIEAIMLPNPYYSGKSSLDMTRDYLQEKNADINGPLTLEKQESLLEVAARLDQAEIVQWLLSEGAATNRQNADGKTALDAAREEGNLACMRVLADHGAELTDADVLRIGSAPAPEIASNQDFDINQPDEHGRTLLFTAVHDREPELVAELIRLGADPGRTNDDGSTPLGLALEMNDPAILELLWSRNS